MGITHCLCCNFVCVGSSTQLDVGLFGIKSAQALTPGEILDIPGQVLLMHYAESDYTQDGVGCS